MTVGGRGAAVPGGHDPIVPDLVGAATTADPGRFAREAAQAVGGGDEVVVVGHSAAGALLPLVAGLVSLAGPR